jgi:hypothetical protein
MIEQPQHAQKTGGGSLFDNACLIALKLGKPGTTRKIKEGIHGLKDATGNAPRLDGDADYIRVSKQLYDFPELTAVGKYDTEIRSYIYRVCLPSLSIEGVYVAAYTQIDEIVQTLETMREVRRDLADKACAVFEDRVEEARGPLGPNWDRTDYPSLEDFASEFEMVWKIITLGVPEKLKEVAPHIYEQEKEKEHQQVQDMASGVSDRLRATFRTHIDSMILRLDGERDGGKPRIFRNSLVENAVAFLQQYKRAFADLVDDAELSRLIDLALDVLTEVSPDDLRQSKELRENVVAGLREIQESLDAMGVHAAREQEAA